MRPVTALAVVLIMAPAFSITDATAETEVYRWIDKNGVVNFTDRPPVQTASEKVEFLKSPEVAGQSVSGQSSTNSPHQQASQPSYAEQRREERAEKRREAAQKKQKLDIECADNREVVAALEPFTRVLVTRADGSVERMDDNDRLKRVNAAKDFLATNCDQL